ncbi:MAG: GH3 auxin-responsive promoter family protein [Bacteroidales bacterium]|nr:GH3 auxin-responsive promoter family protein [Bacteroidales bacterium]
MAFVNSLINFFTSNRLLQIESYTTQYADIQKNELLSLLRRAQNTQIGRQYDFGSITDYRTFSERVPVMDYEHFNPYIEKMCCGERDVCWPGMIKWFAKSSGTTNAKSKFIPVTQESLESCHYRGAKDVVVVYTHLYPETQILHGKCLTLGGSKKISQLNENSQVGDLSAILIGNSPFWSQFLKTPTPKIALLSEWEEKLEKITATTVKENVTSLAGVPSWFLILIKHILQKTGKQNLHEVWPNLELFMHGGINFTPYREQYKELCPKGINFMETYNASEGFFGIQTSPHDIGLQLMLDYGIFYEFVPLAEVGNPFPHALPLADVEIGTDYAMVITTNGGLWRYMIGDTVRFTSVEPHKIIISGRTKHYINAFGEELMIDNAEKALQAACKQTGATIREYTAAPVFMGSDNQGCHQWLIEFEKEPNSLDTFRDTLDDALKQLNSDYEAKRYKNITLAPPIVTQAREGLFFDWLKSKGKLGGQNKVPRLANNREYIDSLLSMQ